MRQFILLLFLLTSLWLKSQTQIDSLKGRLEITKEDTQKVKLLNELSKVVRSENLSSSRDYAQQAYELSVKQNYPKGKVISLVNLGLARYFEGGMDAALTNYLTALEEAEKIKFKRFIPNILINIGIIYEDEQHYGEAIANYNKALLQFTELKDEKGLGTVYSNLGSAYYHSKSYRKALEFYDKAKSIVEKYGNKRGLAGIYNNIAGVYSDLKEYHKSLDYYFKSQQIKQTLNDKSGQAVTLNNIGETYFEMHDYRNAIKYSLLSSELCKVVGNKNQLKEAYLSISECYNATGDYQKAYQYHKLYSSVKDSLYTTESAHSMAELETKFKTAEKDKELLIKDIKIKEQQTEAKQQKLIVILLFSGLGLALIAIFFVFKSYRVKQKANILIAKQKELVELKQKEILDSIHYAKRIQRSLLPQEKYIEKTISRLKK
jgi:tetratricopeptide (TPR) repeat protein